MRYIKLFEGIGNNDYYQILTDDNPWAVISTERDVVNFSKNNIKLLSDLFTSKFKDIKIDCKGGKGKVIPFDVTIYRPSKTISIEMIQYEDDWFGVLISPTSINPRTQKIDDEVFAKCDQIDGVIKFLQDYKILNKKYHN